MRRSAQGPEPLRRWLPPEEEPKIESQYFSPSFDYDARMIRAVAFYLDNTLWEVDPVIARAETRWLEWLRENCPRIPERLSIDDLRASRLALAAREPHNAHDFTYLRIASLAQHARECGYDESISEQAFEIFIAE